ncbi:uncharacterized protein [Macrobrachium rosenbergii]|uniref:uncharacterized protein n=1 Tax=Macrobrachium rosenbergii TaxID=79674 RepID=UPI0034D5B31E
MWSAEKTLELIELLHSSPAFWDVTNVDYKNRIKKMDALTGITDKLSVSVSDTEKMKAIKVQFRREHLKLTSLKRSGCSLKKCSWYGYEPLLFLLQGQESRGSRSTVSPERQVAEVDSEQETDAVIESPYQAETPQSASPPRRSSAKRPADEVKEAFHLMKSLAQHVTTRDEYHVSGENVAHKLRACGRSKREISMAQHKINEIILNLEMGYFGEGATQFTQQTSCTGQRYSGFPVPTSQAIPQYFTAPSGASTPSRSPSQTHLVIIVIKI